MSKHIVTLFMFISIATGQVSNRNINGINIPGNDTLVDLFPLVVGNQWTYKYLWSVYTSSPVSVGAYEDTGTVLIKVVDKIIMTDSTRWLMQETFHLWAKYDTEAFYGPTITIDTIQLIELQQGQHRLYIDGSINKIIQSVFPFLPNVDTMVYRYNTVTADSMRTFTSRNGMGKGVFKLSFKQGVGLFSVLTIDGCTCMDGYYGNHSLLNQIITDVSYFRQEILSQNYRLLQNYPNPFNPSTTISFNLPTKSFVTLKIYDIIGREVATLVNDDLIAGSYTRRWNAVNMSSGLYFYRLQIGSITETKKLVLLK
jgi:hypothetical protein